MFKSTVNRLRSSPIVYNTITRNSLATNSTPRPVLASFNLAVKEAEKVVGYPTSFLNLRWLLNDEIAHVASHIKKLVHVEHPLIETAKGFLFMNDVPTWGLIVLLVAKCGGLNNVHNVVDIDRTAGILHSQRILADVAEMIRTSILVHRGLLNPDEKMEVNHDLNFGNKLALLCGDYILSKCFNDLANIKNHDVNDLISSTLRDLTENEFLGQRDVQNFPIPAQPFPMQQQQTHSDLIDTCNMGPYQVNEVLGHSQPEWFLRSILGGANLLGKSCQAVCILSNQDDKLQESAFLLGKYIGLAWQIKIEVEAFLRRDFGSYFLVSAPVMWCLSSHPELYDDIAKGARNIQNCDFDKIHEFISRTTAIEECRVVQSDLIKGSFQFLETFEESPAQRSLWDLLESLKF